MEHTRTTSATKAWWGSTGEASRGTGETKARSGTANTCSGTSKTSRRHASTCRASDTRTSSHGRSTRTSRTILCQSRRGICRRRTLDSRGDNVSSANDGKTKSTLLLGLYELRLCLTRSGRLCGLALDSAKLFRVGEDEVHVLVEGEHLAGHLATVHHGDAQAVVDQALHLALLVCGHGEGRCARTRLV
jgi:hypothetical protein